MSGPSPVSIKEPPVAHYGSSTERQSRDSFNGHVINKMSENADEISTTEAADKLAGNIFLACLIYPCTTWCSPAPTDNTRCGEYCDLTKGCLAASIVDLCIRCFSPCCGKD